MPMVMPLPSWSQYHISCLHVDLFSFNRGEASFAFDEET